MNGRRGCGGLALMVAAIAAAACSHVDFRWRAVGYDPSVATAVKRLAIVGVADAAAAPGLPETLGVVAAEYAKLRRNYLVRERPQAGGGHEGACAAEGIDGVLVLHGLEARADEHTVALTMRAELWRCRGPQLLWQAQGHRSLPAHDKHLVALTESYRSSLGEQAARWAAASFALAQELLDSLPDPTLTEQDIEEKLELGARSVEVPSPAQAAEELQRAVRPGQPAQRRIVQA